MPDHKGSTLIPTMNLRWVKRIGASGVDADGNDYFESDLVLQQMFETPGGKRLWLDIPIVNESEETEG